MTSVPVYVQPLAEVRDLLSQVVARFRREGAAAEPIVFGSHRKPEAVLLPYGQYMEFQALREKERRRLVEQATASVRAEGLEPPTFADEIAERWIRGEITEEEMREETLRHYRGT